MPTRSLENIDPHIFFGGEDNQATNSFYIYPTGKIY